MDNIVSVEHLQADSVRAVFVENNQGNKIVMYSRIAELKTYQYEFHVQDDETMIMVKLDNKGKQQYYMRLKRLSHIGNWEWYGTSI